MRKRRAVKRDVLADPIYKSKTVAKLINTIMLDGKKGTAQTIVYEAFEQVKTKTGKEPLEVFTEAMENIRPQLEVKSRRVGGSNYQVPVEVTPARSQALALRWLTKYSRERGGKGMADVERSSIRGASDDFYLFHHINDVPFNEKGELMETEESIRLARLFDEHILGIK